MATKAKGKVGDGRATRIAIGCLQEQGRAAEDAAGAFAEMLRMAGDGEARTDVVPMREAISAGRRLRRGELDVVVLRDGRHDRKVVADVLADAGRKAGIVAWSHAQEIRLSLFSGSWMRVAAIKAVIIDDDAHDRVAGSLAKLLPRGYVRYGCRGGDQTARVLSGQPDAFMPGTAIVCSPSTGKDLGMHLMEGDIVDEGFGTCPFVAVASGDAIRRLGLATADADAIAGGGDAVDGS